MADHFDKVAAEYAKNQYYHPDSEYTQTVADYMIRHVQLPASARVLDIGCGNGGFTALLHHAWNLEKKIVAVEPAAFSPSAQDLTHLEFIRQDALEFTKSCDDQFDLIIFKETIHFFSTKQLKVLAEQFKKILSPQGRVLVVTRPEYPTIPLYKEALKVWSAGQPSQEEIIKPFVDSGFQVQQEEYPVHLSLSKQQWLEFLDQQVWSIFENIPEKTHETGLAQLQKELPESLSIRDTLFFLTLTRGHE